MTDRLFPSKVLLFGEYTVLTGGSALAIPFSKFKGKWARNLKLPPLPHQFIEHLESINYELHRSLNISKLREYLAAGWGFDSSIPRGMGLGSSAALSASIYYSLSEPEDKKFEYSWKDLSLIESYFHGKSSGLDAIVSFTNAPVALNANKLESLIIPNMSEQIYLFDSEQDRETQPLVEWYRYRIKNREFMQTMERLSSWNSEAIEALKGGQSVLGVANEISNLQFSYLTHLIPPKVNRIWKKTLDDPKTAMKLCGAGGGGYFLILTERTREDMLKTHPNFNGQICTIK